MLIINFGENITHSLHVNCFVRIISGDKILLTSSDEYFLKDGTHKTEEDFKKEEEKGIIADKHSLLAANIKAVKKLLRNRKVLRIDTTLNADLFISFDNGVVIQIMPDCIAKSYEYYRFIKFEPHWNEDFDKFKSSHFVVRSEAGNITGVWE